MSTKEHHMAHYRAAIFFRRRLKAQPARPDLPELFYLRFCEERSA